MVEGKKAGEGPRLEARGAEEAEESVDLEEASEEGSGVQVDPPSLAGAIPWHEEHGDRLCIAFAGGKGGAGRTLLAANLAVFMSRLGREVVLADLDPAGMNLHTYLGLDPLLPTPGSMLRPAGPPRVDKLAGLNLRLCRPPRSIDPSDHEMRAEVLTMAQSLEADVLILDLGLSADAFTLDTFQMAHAGVVVFVPEPAAMERGYGFIRAALFRRLLHGDDDPAVVARAVLAADHVGELSTPSQLVSALSGAHPHAAEAVRARILSFFPRIVVNMCRTRADAEVLEGAVSGLRRRWGVSADPLAAIDYDDAAWNSTRQRRSFMIEFPGSNLAQGIERVARRLLLTSTRRDIRA